MENIKTWTARKLKEEAGAKVKIKWISRVTTYKTRNGVPCKRAVAIVAAPGYATAQVTGEWMRGYGYELKVNPFTNQGALLDEKRFA